MILECWLEGIQQTLGVGAVLPRRSVVALCVWWVSYIGEIKIGRKT